MNDVNPASGRKRARLFGRDPLPGFVFGLDTSTKGLRVAPSSSLHNMPSTSSAASQNTALDGVAGGGSAPPPRVATPKDTPSLAIQENPVGAEEIPAGFSLVPTSPAAPGGPGNIPAGTATAIGANEAEGLLNSGKPCAAAAPATEGAGPAAAAAPETSSEAAATAVAAAVAPSAAVIPPSNVTASLSPAQPVSGAAAMAAGAAAVAAAVSVPAIRIGEHVTKVDGDRRGNNTPKAAKSAPAKSAGVEASVSPGVPEAPDSGGGSRGSDGHVSSRAASLVSSFLKRGSTASMPSPRDMPHISASSPPKTPISLASLVAGVSPGSGGSAPAGFRTPTAGTDNGTRTPRRGGDRFFHGEWPPSLKKRRRILYYPKPNDPVGRRILYWVRGNSRVKDNLGLSVACWLSAQTQLPLQAVTFVDPAIGLSMPSCNVVTSSGGRMTRLSGARGEQHDAERQEVPFGMAVEMSALCEMEEALRALNVPLVAIACAESEVPSALACWCGGGTGSSSAPAAAHPPSAGSTVAGAVAAAGTAATADLLPTEGSVEITIMDECYHPRQLLLSEKVKEALRGTGALYAVDSSCVYPINTSGGGLVGGQAGAGAGTGGATTILSPEEFRRSQEGCLPAVLTDLTPKPRLPLQSRLQNQMFTPGDRRAILPRRFEDSAQSTAGAAFTVLSWSKLRELSANRFSGFGKPVARPAEGFTQDLIPLLGGGERVGEAALRQTLELTAAFAPDGQRLTDSTTGGGVQGGTDCAPSLGNCTILANEIAGLGFGGCLLHLLRLGSISSLSVVQALLCRPPGADTGADTNAGGKEQHPKMCESRRRLLEKVLKREYILYRSHSYHRKMMGRAGGTAPAATMPGSISPAAAKGQFWRGWMGIMPAWVWKELKKGQRDAKQVRLTTGARLHPSLASYWARAVVKMVLIPSQAVSLLVDMAEEFCLGAANAGDVVPELLDSAFGVLKLPQTPVAAGTVTRVPSPGQALETEEGLRSALGGRDALARFLSPLPVPPPPTLRC